MSVGLDPMIAVMNDIRVIDGYHTIYPLSYMIKFRKIIERELDNNIILKNYYDNFGSRVYAFYTDKNNIMLNFRSSGGMLIFSPEISRFSSIIFPLLGISSPAIRRSRVDFPHPDGPRMERNSYFSKCRLKPLTASSVPKDFERFIHSIMLKKLALRCRLPQLAIQKNHREQTDYDNS